MNLCVFTRYQGLFGELSLDSDDEMMDLGEGEEKNDREEGGEGEMEEGEVEEERNDAEKEKEGEGEKGGEKKKKRRKGNKEETKKKADETWIDLAISNGRANLNERDASRAPVRNCEASFLDSTNTGEGANIVSDYHPVVSPVPSSFDPPGPVSSSLGDVWYII